MDKITPEQMETLVRGATSNGQVEYDTLANLVNAFMNVTGRSSDRENNYSANPEWTQFNSGNAQR